MSPVLTFPFGPMRRALREKMRGAARLSAALALTLAMAGCATIEMAPQTPSNQAMIVPPEAPRTTGVETPASAEQKRLVALFGGKYNWPAAEHYIDSVLIKLAAVSDQPGEAYRVTILNSPIVNAFALPSGDLFVTRGLLALANDTSEVAAVMAHEIGHVTAGHALLRAENEKKQALLSHVSDALQSKQRGEQVKTTNLMSFASFSRQQEFEADQIGVRTIAKAGYDPYAASRFLTSLGRSISMRAALFGQSQNEKPDLMSSHPSTPERIQRAIMVARQYGAPGIGDTAQPQYLAAIDGMDFGDDPSEGVIRGRRFSHPRLGFGFIAPDGFVLENTPQAVLGVADGGAQALRLDSVRVPAETPLETYLNSGWIEGLQQASIQTVTINGLPAATATAKSGDWSFRLAAIRLGADVYRMIFATRTLTDDGDTRYRDSINSFRRLPNEEASKLRPLRIVIVTAAAGDTADKLGARMVVTDRPLEQFLLLNGIEKAGPLKAGEGYKIIAE